jgi:HEAT repeat protein
LIAALKDSDGPNRLQILFVLQNIGEAEKEILPVAAGLLKDGDIQVRMSAVNLLGNQGSAALPHLIVALKDSSPLVRFNAVGAIQRIPGDIKEALPDLVPLLKDGAPFQRRSVVMALGRVGAPAVPTLIDLLGDKENVVRTAAVTALTSVGPDAKKSVPTLSDMALQDTYLLARRNAVVAVATIEPEKLKDLFARVKKHNDDKVRLTAYQALYFRVGKKGAVTALPAKVALPYLLEATKDGAVSVRLIAAQGLGNLGADAKDAIPALTALTQDADVNVRNAATQALTQIKGKS